MDNQTLSPNGIALGPSHEENGIKGIVSSTGEPIEFEGGEVIIAKESVEIQGNCEKLSQINQEGGGDPIPCPNEIPKTEILKFSGYRYFEGLNPLSYNKDVPGKYGSGIYLSTNEEKFFDRGKSRAYITINAQNPIMFESSGSIPNLNFTRAMSLSGTISPVVFMDELLGPLGHDAVIIKHGDEHGDEVIFRNERIVEGNDPESKPVKEVVLFEEIIESTEKKEKDPEYYDKALSESYDMPEFGPDPGYFQNGGLVEDENRFKNAISKAIPYMEDSAKEEFIQIENALKISEKYGEV
jgi:hypothetical protein